MKRLAYTLTMGILLGFLLLVTFPVQAGTSASANESATACSLKGSGPLDRMALMLDTLEEKEFDVSAIRAALDSGDSETARTLLKQFLQENKDALAKKPPRGVRPAIGISQDGTGSGPAIHNLASTGNTTASRLHPGKGGLGQKRLQTV